MKSGENPVIVTNCLHEMKIRTQITFLTFLLGRNIVALKFCFSMFNNGLIFDNIFRIFHIHLHHKNS